MWLTEKVKATCQIKYSLGELRHTRESIRLIIVSHESLQRAAEKGIHGMCIFLPDIFALLFSSVSLSEGISWQTITT